MSLDIESNIPSRQREEIIQKVKKIMFWAKIFLAFSIGLAVLSVVDLKLQEWGVFLLSDKLNKFISE